MTEETVPRIRQRINISQTAKGLHQVEVTLEMVEPTSAYASSSGLADHALQLLQAIEKKLKDDKRKLATEESSS